MNAPLHKSSILSCVEGYWACAGRLVIQELHTGNWMQMTCGGHMRVEHKIQDFFNALAEERKSIGDVGSERHRRILLFAVFEILGRCAYPEESQCGKRFVRLVDEHSGWDDRHRISIPQLDCLLETRATDPNAKVLVAYVQGRLAKCTYGSIYRSAEVDPLDSELKPLAATEELVNVIDRARYPRLLWKMRNYLVHELRMPGRGMEISNDHTTPYYHAHTTLPGTIPFSWEFYIPYAVFRGLTDTCSDSVRDLMVRECRNPYDVFRSQTSWTSRQV